MDKHITVDIIRSVGDCEICKFQLFLLASLYIYVHIIPCDFTEKFLNIIDIAKLKLLAIVTRSSDFISENLWILHTSKH
jgi:hypothetical protein